MAILVNSRTDDRDANYWATSWEAFCDAEVLYGREFQIDVATEPASTLGCRWFGCHVYLKLPAIEHFCIAEGFPGCGPVIGVSIVSTRIN